MFPDTDYMTAFHNPICNSVVPTFTTGLYIYVFTMQMFCFPTCFTKFAVTKCVENDIFDRLIKYLGLMVVIVPSILGVY